MKIAKSMATKRYHLPLLSADLDALKTPCYAYDMALLRHTIETASTAAGRHAGFRLHYAIKANWEEPVLRLMSRHGLGADCVSIGEVERAISTGFTPESVVFAGVGKRDDEIDAAITAGIGCFNVESLEELEVIAERASALGKTVPVALRVNPDIDAHTHHYITTGLAENKFGIPRQMLDAALDMVVTSEWLELHGLHFHIGSQITVMEPFRVLCQRVNELQEEYRQRGITFATINLGGGLGVDYDDPDDRPLPDFEEFFSTIGSKLRVYPSQEVHFELGRSLVAQSGTLLSRVLYVKKGLEKNFAIIDAGFTDMIRPALYGAHHLIQNLTSTGNSTERYDVVGPICESSDVFGADELLPLTRRGDILAIRTTGAYGATMAMRYNCRELPGTKFIDKEEN